MLSEKKVLLVMPSFGFGGIERVFTALANQLVQDNDVCLCALALVDKRAGESLAHKVKVVTFGSGHRVLRHSQLLRHSIRCRDLIRELRPDLIMSAYPLVNAVVGLALRLLPGPRPIWLPAEHGDPQAYLGSGLRRLAKTALLRYSIKGASHAIAVSAYVARTASPIYGSIPVSVLPNPVIDPETLWSTASESVDHPWFSDSGIPIVIAVGRMDPGKDFSTLVRAVGCLSKRYNLRLVILGDGPDRPRLVELVRNLNLNSSVWMPGFVTNVARYVSRSSVFVLPSRSEGQPLALIEALALGVPVVVSSFAGVDEFVTDGVNGIVFPVGSCSDLAESIASIIEKPELREKMARLAPSSVGHFSVKSSLSAYRRLFDDVVDHRNSRRV
jgi:glycosyltransferase involved in cell wall biosynthesis